MARTVFSKLESTRIGRFEAAWYFHAFVTELVLIYPVFGIMMLESVSKLEFSLLLVVWSGVAILLEIPLGTLADRFDRRLLLSIAGIIEGGCFIFWLLMPGFWGYLLGFATWAVAGALQSGTTESLIYDTIRKSAGENPDSTRKVRWIESIYTRIYGRSLAARSLGATFALFVGGYLAAWMGYDAVLLLSVISPWLGAIALWMLIRDPRQTNRQAEQSSFADVIRDAVAEIVPNRGLRHFLLAFCDLGRNLRCARRVHRPLLSRKTGGHARNHRCDHGCRATRRYSRSSLG